MCGKPLGGWDFGRLGPPAQIQGLKIQGNGDPCRGIAAWGAPGSAEVPAPGCLGLALGWDPSSWLPGAGSEGLRRRGFQLRRAWL